jgi:hypothetical protein
VGDDASAQRYLKLSAELNAPDSSQAVLLLAGIHSEKGK